MRRMRMVIVTAAVAILALGACSSSSAAKDPGTSVDTTTPPTTLGAPTTAAASNVRILSLSGPTSPLLCNAPTQVELHWVTHDAKAVTLQINSGPVFASYPNGTGDELVPLACTGEPQTYLLTAHAPNGAIASKSLTITERESSSS